MGDDNSLIVINEYFRHVKGSLSDALEDYTEILNTLITLSEILVEAKAQIPNWKVYSQIITLKVFFHSQTLKQILTGQGLEMNGLPETSKYIDIPSARIILRAHLESVLTFHFMYINPRTDAEKEYRIKVWLYSGLKSRDGMTANTGFAQSQKDKDQQDMSSLKNEISNSPFFNQLTNNQQRQLLQKGSPRLWNSWKDIIDESGLGGRYDLKEVYSMLSNYAHTEAISVLQIKDLNFSYTRASQDAKHLLFHSKMLNIFIIEYFVNEYKIIKIRYNMLPQKLRTLIELYGGIKG